jgi:hypothetical protein
MESMKTPGARPAITQTRNNTSFWIGHLQTDPTEHFAGQTFHCPTDGQVDNIQIYSATVQQPGEIVLSLHSFDEENQNWGPSIGSSVVEVKKHDEEKWIRFELPPVSLQRNQVYGFRVHTKNGMVAIGEAAAGVADPFNGIEWNGDSNNRDGNYYRYFNLAFKVELCA